MTTETETEEDALLAVLPALADEIALEAAAQEDRFARRLSIFRRLTDLGTSQRRIAEAAKITPMAVSYALGVDRRREQTPATKPKGKAGKKASR